VDGRGRIRWAYKEWPDEAWRGWHLLVLAARSTPAGYLAEALARMGERLGVKTVLSTAGGG
jgi:2,5-diamino-6-(ribosylamino)-4(3H)-pyrimidinone 5'-phosphate reductase